MAAIAVTLPGASGNIYTSQGNIAYFGFSVRETAGAVASFRIRDGGATGIILDTVSLSANQSTADFYGPQGLRCPSGILYYEKIAGTIEGSVRVG